MGGLYRCDPLIWEVPKFRLLQQILHNPRIRDDLHAPYKGPAHNHEKLCWEPTEAYDLEGAGIGQLIVLSSYSHRQIRQSLFLDS